MKKFYQAVLEKTSNGVSVCFPDFPGCVSGGRTYSDAMQNGRKALEFHLDGMLADHEEVPAESDPAALDESLRHSGRGEIRIAMLEVEAPDGVRERINITMPRYVLRRIDAFAGAMNRTRSAFLSEAALSFIRSH